MITHKILFVIWRFANPSHHLVKTDRSGVHLRSRGHQSGPERSGGLGDVNKGLHEIGLFGLG